MRSIATLQKVHSDLCVPLRHVPWVLCPRKPGHSKLTRILTFNTDGKRVQCTLNSRRDSLFPSPPCKPAYRPQTPLRYWPLCITQPARVQNLGCRRPSLHTGCDTRALLRIPPPLLLDSLPTQNEPLRSHWAHPTRCLKHRRTSRLRLPPKSSPNSPLALAAAVLLPAVQDQRNRVTADYGLHGTQRSLGCCPAHSH